jgi:hypothetical protein
MNIHSIYVESSIFGPLTSRPNPLPHIAATQQATVEWWNFHRHGYELYVSDLVLKEIAQGDASYAELRLRLAEELNRLPISKEIQTVAQKLIDLHAIPDHSAEDAVHVACAAVNRLDCVLTWNCKHIANPRKRDAIERSLISLGWKAPVLITPAQLLTQTNGKD